MASRNKVLVIGLDGATWDLLDPWAAQGHLPTLQQLRSRGAWGDLRTTLPPITPSAWNSMYTGSNPGKHGIFGFNERRKDGYRLAPVHSTARKTKTMFRILSDSGLKVGVLNAPATYPPEPVNGIMVPGIPTPADAPDYTHPREFASRLQAVTGGKHMYPPGGAEGHEEEFLHECDEYVRAVAAATRVMMEELDNWDHVFVQFQATDSVQHAFWHTLDPEHPRHDPAAPDYIRSAILDRYKVIDNCIAEIIEMAGRETNVLITSDHGGGALYEQLYLNIWLLKKGWLKLKSRPISLLRRLLYSAGLTPEFARSRIFRRVPGSVRRTIGSRRYGALALADRIFLSLDDVDWSRTRAYSYGGPLGLIYLNLETREPQGSVPAGEYDRALDELERELHEMRHPETGDLIIESVLRSGQIYEGPYSRQGPDLTLLTKDSKYFAGGFLQFISKNWLGTPWTHWSGNHSLDGMLLISGPDIQNAGHIEGTRIVDIAPTVLALLKQSIPDWMDGQVLTRALSESFLREAAPQTMHEEVASQAPQGGYSAEQEAEIAKRLADLGYIE